MKDPVARAQQRIQFHKNTALLGGLLFAVMDHDDNAHRLLPGLTFRSTSNSSVEPPHAQEQNP